MATTKPGAPTTRDGVELNSGIRPGNVHADDWINFLLALASVGMLGFMLLSPPAYRIGIIIFYVDCGICAVFIAEFFWRWHKQHWDMRFLVRNWYEFFAMIPVAHPALTGHHFILAVLLLIRIGRLIDRALGEQFFFRLVDKLSEPLVDAIKKPVTVAVLDEVVAVLETGNYPENLAKSLKENREELREIISEKLNEDPQLGKFKYIPFHDEIVHAAVDTSFRVMLEVLHDERIDDFFASVVRDNRNQIRRAVEMGLAKEDDEDKEGTLPTPTQRARYHEFDEHHRTR